MQSDLATANATQATVKPAACTSAVLSRASGRIAARHWGAFFAVCCWCFVAGAAPAQTAEAPPPPTVTVETITGERHQGRLLAIAPDELTLAVGSSEERFARDRLAVVEFPHTPRPARGRQLVCLVDGSQLMATDVALSGSESTIRLDAQSAIPLPGDAIHWIRFQKSDESQQRWEEITRDTTDSDRLVLARGTVLSYFDGAVREVGRDDISFVFQGERMTVPRDRAFGLVFHRPEANRGDAAPVEVQTVDGSRWKCSRVELTGESLSLHSLAGFNVEVPLEEIAAIRFHSSALVALIELEPAVVEYTPFAATQTTRELFERLRRPLFLRGSEASETAHRPTLDGRPCRDAIVLHSQTGLTYRLADRYSQFRARVGIADATRPQGDAVLRILGDGDRELWQGTLTGASPAKEVQVDLQGARQLKIEVTFGRNGDIGDVVIIEEARLIQ